MRTLVQLFLFCGLFTGLVRYAVRGGAIDGLYFYPKPVQERAIEIGLSTREEMVQKRKRFMAPFFLIMLAALLFIIDVWNKVNTFGTAYLQALLFLEVMNWFDGIFIDRVWVGNDSFWVLPGTEDIPFVQTWSQVFKKRMFLTGIWIIGAAIVAGIVVLLF
ncbi:MAG: hypothetical protein IJ091_06545 [Oscillospiraceae bacterium]|nr:hypothetical protein [Oscillospiraceae bacterium]